MHLGHQGPPKNILCVSNISFYYLSVRKVNQFSKEVTEAVISIFTFAKTPLTFMLV